MKKIISVMALAGAFFIYSCNNSGTANNTSTDSSTMAQENFDPGKARAAIEDHTRQFSEEYKKGDSAALASHYTSDALMMPANSEAVRKEGLVSAWGSFLRSGVKELRLTVQDVTGNNELLVETGAYELDDANNKMVDKGKYVVVWKNVNGEWKIFRDIFNTNLPAAK